MTKDRSLGMLLMALFGISGTFILIFTWLQPMPGMERVLSTILGAIGLGVALSQVPRMRIPKAVAQTEAVPVKSETGD